MSVVTSVASSSGFSSRGSFITNRLKLFMEESGYQIYQNQFYRLTVPKFESTMEPEEQTEVFLSGLPTTMLEDEIFVIFSSVGQICEIRLMLTASGMLNRSFGYVRYYRQKHADEAVEKLNGCKAGIGKKIGVAKSYENKKLFLKGINSKKSSYEIHMELQSQGVQGVKNVFILEASKINHLNRGFAFVEFINHAAAADAKRNFQNNLMLFDREILIEWATETPKIDDKILLQVKRIIIRNLPLSVTKSLTMRILGFLIPLEQVEKVFRRQNYCFVNFKVRIFAELAIEHLKDFFELYGLHGVEVMFANPSDEENTYTECLPAAVSKLEK